jgi:phosphohistidine phosphatase
MKRIAKGMKALKIQPDVILTSPFPRALRTAEIAAKELELKKQVILTDHLAVGGDPEELVSTIRREYSSAQGVMIVGHEPYLSLLMSVLLSGQANLDIVMKKGGLAKLVTEDLRYGQCATLEWLLAPRVMTRIG